MRYVHLEPLSDASPEPLLRGWHALLVEEWRELIGDVDPPAYGLAVSELRTTSAVAKRAVAAVEDDAVVGAAIASLFPRDDPHLAEVELSVTASARRRGIGSALAREIADVVMRHGRTTVVAGVRAGTAGAAFAERVGATVGLREVRSSLDLRRVDRAEVAALATATTSGYEIVRWVDRCPDELAAAYARVHEGMNEAPRGELDLNDQRWDVDRVRAMEERRQLGLMRAYVVAARHVATGELGGFTDLLVPVEQPTTGHQADTAVVPGHRGHGLGLRVKAAMLDWLLDVEPRLRVVTTWNAASNEHMLRVNRRLGFFPMDEWAMYQVAAERLVALPTVMPVARPEAPVAP